nr:ankyrin repeat and KH domain containing protein [Hymenolepis microstoma]
MDEQTLEDEVKLNARLFDALENSDIFEVDKIIQMGANVNAIRMRDGETPLLIATGKGDLAMMELLLLYGAAIHRIDANGNYAIHRATRLGHLEGVKLLMDNGSLAFVGNRNFDTPLMIASMHGHTEIVKYLLSKNIPMMYQLNRKARSELTLATAQGHIDIVTLLLDKGDPSKDRAIELNQALRIAVNANNLEIIRILLDSGADPNTKDMVGIPLIMIPLSRRKELIVRQLLLKGTDIETRDSNGYTLLMRSIILGDANFVRMFIKLGANLNAIQTNGTATALSLAKFYEDPEIIEIVENALKEDEGRT